MLALDQARLALTRVDRASDQATASMSRGFTSASRTIGTSMSAATGAATGFRFSLGQLTRQVGEFGTQVAAGRNPVEAFTRNLSQALVFMGPMGAAAGIAAVSLGALAQSFRDAGQDAEELKARAQEVDDALGALGDIAQSSATDVDALVTKILKMSEAMQAVKTAQLAAGIDQIGAASEVVGGQLDELIRTLEQVGPDAATRIRAALQAGGVGAAMAQAMREGVGAAAPGIAMQLGVALSEVLRQRFTDIEPLELVAPEQAAQARELADELERAIAEGGDPQAMAAVLDRMNQLVEQAEELALGLDMDEPLQRAKAALREQRDIMAQLIDHAVRLNEERQAGAEAEERLRRERGLRESGVPFLPAEVGGVSHGVALRGEREQEAIREQIEAEKRSSRRGPRPPPTFAEATAPLEREIALLNEIGVTRGQISQIMSVERQIKRGLSEAERDNLEAVLATRDALQQRRAISTDVEGIQLEIDARGRVTEELRVQQSLLKVRTAQGFEVAAAVEQDIRQAERLRSELGEVNATRDISDYIEQVELAVQFGGRETEEYRAQIQILELKQRLGGEISADLEAQVRHAQRLTSELRGAQAARSLREGIAGQRLELEQASNTAMMQMLHLPTSEQGRIDQRMLGLEQQFGMEQAEGMRALVAESERFNTQLTLMTETAPAISDALADFATMAIFEGPEEAAKKFAASIVELIIRIGMLQAVMGAMGAFGGFGGGVGAGAPVNQFATNTTGLGGAGFSLPTFGGPRQHGGRVDPRHSYLVGEGGQPEMFVPDAAGMVMPLVRGGGGGGGAGGGAGGGGDVHVNAQPMINITNTMAGAEVKASPPRMGADGSSIVDVMVSSSLDRLHSGGQLDPMLRGRRGVRRS